MTENTDFMKNDFKRKKSQSGLAVCSKKHNYHNLFKCRKCQKLRFNKQMNGHKHDLTLVLSIKNRLAQCVGVCEGVC